MSVKGMEGMSDDQIAFELKNGGKFVVYQYCISIVIMTFRQPTGLVFIKNGEKGILKGLPYVLITAVLGWWGFPWGPIYTIGAIVTNLSGGKDVTKEILQSMGREDLIKET